MQEPIPFPDFHLADGMRAAVELNNGVRMPVFGLGSFRLSSGHAARDAVQEALAAGYRLIDTAAMYGNESDVGAAVRASGVPRDEVFLTTKLWNDDQGFDSALRAFERSRKALGVSSVDLYLLHWPVADLRAHSWRALTQLLRDSRCRSIGVSNFTVAHLEQLLEATEVVPAVNQVEFSPFLFQKELLEYCQRHRIQLEAYSPLTKGRRLNDTTLQRIAGAHEATPAQVMIRWGLQRSVVEIPKSANPGRIRENAGVFRFELNPAEMDALDHLDEGFRTSWDPTTVP